MSFKEKITWLTLATMVVTYGVYFTLVARMGPAAPLISIAALFAVVTAAQVVVIVIGTVAITVTAQREAKAPADERDLAIARRASSGAYYALVTGMIVVGIVMPSNKNPAEIIHTALLALVIAEVMRHAMMVISYRRGWHG
ncbi:MAG: hypothetical protein WC803_00135 [Sphingomonas sp.]